MKGSRFLPVSLAAILMLCLFRIGSCSAESRIRLQYSGNPVINSSGLALSVYFPGAEEYMMQVFDPQGELVNNFSRTLYNGEDAELEFQTPTTKEKAGVYTFLIVGYAGDELQQEAFTLNIGVSGSFSGAPAIIGEDTLDPTAGYSVTWDNIPEAKHGYKLTLYGKNGSLLSKLASTTHDQDDDDRGFFYSAYDFRYRYGIFPEYLIKVSAGCDGYETVESTKTVKTVNYRTDDRISLTVSSSMVNVGETIEATVEAPGADWVRLYDENGAYTVSGDRNTWRLKFDSEGDKNLFAYAYYNGSTASSFPITVSICNEVSLQKPQIECTPYILKGEEQRISIQPVSNATGYYYALNRVEDINGNAGSPRGDRPLGWPITYRYMEKAETMVLDTSDMEQGRYQVVAGACRGDTWQYEYADFFVIGKSPKGPTVERESRYCFLDRDARFTLHADGASRFAVRVQRREENGDLLDVYGFDEYRQLWTEIEAVDGTAVFSTKAGPSKGTVIIYARAFADGVWSKTTTGQCSVYPAQQLDRPAVSVPLPVSIGSSVTATITPVEGAEQYSVQIVHSQEGSLYEATVRDGEFVIPEEIFFETGNEYTLFLSAQGTGYLESEKTACPLTVTGTREEGPELSTDRSVYRIQDAVVFTARMPGADRFVFQYRKLVNGLWQAPEYAEKADADEARLPLVWIHNQKCTALRCRVRARAGEVYTSFSDWTEVTIQPDPYWDGGYLSPPSGLKVIGEEAFAGIPARRVNIPRGVYRIGRRAFAGCTYLTSIVIPESVRRIEDDAFSGCGEWLIIRGKKNSEAEEFAALHNITFEEMKD